MEVMPTTSRRPPTWRRPSTGKRCIVKAGIKGNSLTRMASGKYDLDLLREFTKTEEEALKDLVIMYQVENEDKLPISFDLHQLVDLKEDARRAFLGNMLHACPAVDAVPAFISKYLAQVNDLDARVTDAICATGPTIIFATGRRFPV
ncbi:unnamed protein product [Scytosiphon promiscuus]